MELYSSPFYDLLEYCMPRYMLETKARISPLSQPQDVCHLFTHRYAMKYLLPKRQDKKTHKDTKTQKPRQHYKKKKMDCTQKDLGYT